MPKQLAGMFNPVTGRLWFQTPDGYGSVDPKTGPGSSRREAGSPDTNFATGGANAIYFAPGGRTPLDAAGIAYDTFGPSGIEADYQPVAPGYAVGRAGKVSDSSPVVPISKYCWPRQFISERTFLCADAQDSSQLYAMKINAALTKIQQQPLLPSSDYRIGDAIVDPSGRQLAFIATRGDTASLFITTLGSHTEPRKVADVDNSGLGPGYLVAWN